MTMSVVSSSALLVLADLFTYRLIKYDTFSEDVTKFYMAECILAIEAVHRLGFIHRLVPPLAPAINGQSFLTLLSYPVTSSRITSSLTQRATSSSQTSVFRRAFRSSMTRPTTSGSSTAVTLQARRRRRLRARVARGILSWSTRSTSPCRPRTRSQRGRRTEGSWCVCSMSPSLLSRSLTDNFSFQAYSTVGTPDYVR